MNIYKADNSTVTVSGRTVYRGGTRWLGYSCTSIEFCFDGKTVSAEITTDWKNDEPWKEIFRPYLAVFVNGADKPLRRFSLDEGTHTYELYSSERAEKVALRLMKLSENAFSRAGIISLSADGVIKPAERSSVRKIEFIGDSITCGFGIEGRNGTENFSTATENPWENYAALTARHFDADFSLVSWSGIGILSNSIPPDADEPDTGWLMPKIYPYTDMGTEGFLGVPEGETELWDGKAQGYRLIVINLGTNDNYYTKGIPEREESFEKACYDFLISVRKVNPDAYILYALGVMGQELCPRAEAAVKKFALTDKKASFMRFDVQSEADGIGSEGHPNLITHKKMSDALIKETERLRIF